MATLSEKRNTGLLNSTAGILRNTSTLYDKPAALGVLKSRKRKRPITSCSECYRRKQKCDRELPCAICTIRGIPEKTEESKVLPPKHLPVEAGDEEAEPIEDGLVPPSDIDVQIGYSSATNSNFGILQKTLQHGDDIIGPPSLRMTRDLPHFMLLQIKEIEKQLPARALQLKLIDLYFSECWWWFSSLEPTSFRQKLDTWYKAGSGTELQNESDAKDHPYFSALLFQTLAVSLQYVHPGVSEIWKELQLRDAKSTDLLSIKYSKAGMQIMDLLGRHDSTVTAVQHDMLRGIWLKNFSRGTESWYSVGNAIRQAQELNLHKRKQPPSSIHSDDLCRWLWQDQLDQRIWACLFSWDAHVAFTLGRPRIINANDCDLMHLVACTVPEDYLVRPPPIESDTTRPSLIEPVVYLYSLTYLIHDMLNLGTSYRGQRTYEAVANLHKKVDNLLADLPAYYRTQDTDLSFDTNYAALPSMRFHLFTIAQTYITALHRPHVLHSHDSCNAAVTAALNVLGSQEKLFSITERHRLRIYTYSFYTIDAAIFLSALLLERPATLDQCRIEDITHMLLRSLKCLEGIQDLNAMAKTGVQILRKCQTRIQKRAVLTTVPTIPTSISSASETYPEHLSVEPVIETPSDADASQDYANNVASPSFRLWIEQMDSVMLPILEDDSGGLFDNSLWQALLDG